MARTKFEVTQECRNDVISLASLGFRHEDIAKRLKISEKMLKKHFRSELDSEPIRVNEEVMQSLLDMARSGKNTTATLFWAKTRCGLSEAPQEKALETSERPPDVVIVRG